MIISGGVNIYPAEIEDALHRHPKIEDAAVFGVPDDDWGERVHAAVEPRPGETLTADEVRTFCRAHLADYKIPREVSFHTSFPATPQASSSSAFCASPTGSVAPPVFDGGGGCR